MATQLTPLENLSRFAKSSILEDLAKTFGMSGNKPSKKQEKTTEEVNQQLAQSLDRLTTLLKERAMVKDAPKRTLQGDLQKTFIQPFVDIKEYLTGKSVTGKEVKPNDTGSLAPKTELPLGVEPNSEEEKQQDREKLAEAIARKMQVVLDNIDFCCGGGLIPGMGFPGGGGKGGKSGGPANKPRGGGKAPAALGAGLLGRAALGVLSGAAAGYGVYSAIEGPETQKIMGGAITAGAISGANMFGVPGAIGGGLFGLAAGTYKSFKDAEPEPLRAGPRLSTTVRRGEVEDVVKSNLTDEEIISEYGSTRKQLEDWLKNNPQEKTYQVTPYKAISKEMQQPDISEIKGTGPSSAEFAAIDPRRLDLKAPVVAPSVAQVSIPEKAVDILPKEASTLTEVVDKVMGTNLDLKMFSPQGQTAIAQPIISNRTINNTEQTYLGASPAPFNNTNSFLRWQNSRSNFTDR